MMKFNEMNTVQKVDYLSDMLGECIFNIRAAAYQSMTQGEQLQVKQDFHQTLKAEEITLNDEIIKAVEEELPTSPITAFLVEYVALNDTKHERSITTKMVNSKLQIVKMSNQKFAVPGGYMMLKGYALYHPVFGFFGFKGDNKPYTPAGGKKTLQSILNEGGLLDFTDSEWWTEKI